MSAAHDLSGSIAMFEDTTAKPTGQPQLPAEIVCDEAGLSTVGASSASAVFGELWDRVRRKLRAELGEDVVTSWFGSLELSGVVGGVAQLSVPTRFLKSWIDTHYAERLRKHFALDGYAAGIEVRVRGANGQHTPVKLSRGKPRASSNSAV